MKIPISKSQKTELLKAIKAGEFNTEIFPELKDLKPVKDEARELTNVDPHDPFFRNTKY